MVNNITLANVLLVLAVLSVVVYLFCDGGEYDE